MWFGGAEPSQADAQVLGEIGTHVITAAEYPNLFAWWALASKFAPNIRSKWPAAQQPAKAETKPA